MSTKRAWIINLNKKSLFKSLVNNEERYILIGYENGLNERKKELYFAQREQDPDSYIISFKPEPYFITYSFFSGFFGQTIKNLCVQNFMQEDNAGMSRRKMVLKQFLNKYRFSFTQNDNLGKVLKNYASAMIENIIDIQSKMEKI